MSSDKAFSDKLFSNLKVQLEIKIGEIDTDIKSVLNMKSGDVLESKVKLSENISLLYEGKEIASGTLVERDGCFAIQITKVSD
ncbi:FliM/FliN family flagellar motor C-terminal domain-containing protein [Vibrio vulnificus]|nr:FliM/FliN family flagellar motor switch protein [Vibrio vulnificus]